MSVCGRRGCKTGEEERMSIMADEAVKAIMAKLIEKHVI